MKIGLYFGSFNPIHVGHLIIAEHVINFTDIEQIWFIISPQNPLKQNQTVLNKHDRLKLLRLSIDNNINFVPSNVEFELPKPSFTSITLKHLKEMYPENLFSIIMGSDNFCNLHKWQNYEFIINNYYIYVYLRKNFDVINEFKNVYTLKAPYLNISSSMIRKLIKEKKSIKYLVTEEVRVEIENSNYYK